MRKLFTEICGTAKLKDKDKTHVIHLTVDPQSLRAAVEERQWECVEKQWYVNSK